MHNFNHGEEICFELDGRFCNPTRDVNNLLEDGTNAVHSLLIEQPDAEAAYKFEIGVVYE